MMNSLRYLLLSVVFLFIISACGSDDGGGGTSVDIGVSTISVADIENRGDASDIQVSFKISTNEANVEHYRIFVVKASARSSFDLAAAEATASASYVQVAKTGSDILTFLNANLLDSDGEAVVEARAYVIFVLAVGVTGTDSVLGVSTAQLALAKTNLLSILAELPIGTGGVVVDSDGNVYCADFGASLSSAPGTLLYKVTPGGQASIFASGFIGASGNTIGPDGNIYQSNIGGNKISKVTMDGTVSDYITGIQGPVGVVFDDAGNLYVASCGGQSVVKVNPNGAGSSIFASGSIFNCPNGITIDNNGNLYVANFGNGNVVKITPAGATSVLATLPGGNNGHITFFENNLYVVARAANQVYKVTLNGSASLLVGSGQRGHDTGAARLAELSLPNDLGFSPDGSILYINDSKPLNGTPSTSQIKPTMLKKVRIEKD